MVGRSLPQPLDSGFGEQITAVAKKNMEIGRRGFFFQTRQGTEYYYDDFTGLVFPAPPAFKETLFGFDPEKLKNISPVDHTFWEKFILDRYKKLGAFFGSENNGGTPVQVNKEYVEHTVNHYGFRQLILNLTGSRHLHSSYYSKSDVPPPAEKPSSDLMSWDTAKAAADFYFNALKKIRRHDPCRPGVVSFSGGEPLLNFSVLEKTVNDIHSQGIDNVFYTIRTNGILLDGHIAEFLVKNNFAIWVSLDGMKTDHDRNRVYADGQGSFDTVFANIEKFWQRYPDFTLLCFLVTHDWDTDLVKMRRFFKDHKRFRDSLFMFNPVGPHFTDSYKIFSSQQRDIFFSSMQKLKKELFPTESIKDPLLSFFIEMPYRIHLLRRILGPRIQEDAYAPSTCIPGEKICVLPDGWLQPSEKAAGSTDVGDVRSGLDFETMAGLINTYNESITANCKNCPIIRLCRDCFSRFWSEKEFCQPTPSFCRDQLAHMKTVLEDTYSILEENPNYGDDILHNFHKKYFQILSLNY